MFVGVAIDQNVNFNLNFQSRKGVGLCFVLNSIQTETPAFNSVQDLLESAWFPHVLRAVIAVGSSTVPLAWHRFRVERNDHSKVFGNSMEQKTSYPQLVTHCDTFTWSDLVKTDRLNVE